MILATVFTKLLFMLHAYVCSVFYSLTSSSFCFHEHSSGFTSQEHRNSQAPCSRICTSFSTASRSLSAGSVTRKQASLQTDHAVLHVHKKLPILICATQMRPHFGVRKRHLVLSISDRYLECRCAACALQLSCDHRGWREHPGDEHTWLTSHWAWVPTCEAGLLGQKADSPDETSWPSLRAADLLGPPDLSICEKHCGVAN